MSDSKVKWVEIDDRNAGQRIDNFLLSYFGKVPKSRIYRALRNGEVRVNKGRIKPIYRLKLGDSIRIPPLYVETSKKSINIPAQVRLNIDQSILFEDESILVVNKPVGLAAHSGTGDLFGVIEVLRAIRTYQPFLELAHRIDKETSGCLLIAKSRKALLSLQEALKSERTIKEYTLFVKGSWRVKKYAVEHALKKASSQTAGAKMQVDTDGQAAYTEFTTLDVTPVGSLMSASIRTGRTHQIRVHAQSQHHPIAGDPRYGDFEYNRAMKKAGLNRMFLHAKNLHITLSATGKKYELEAPLPDDLHAFAERSKLGHQS